jgi:hypothetical protein
MKNTSALLAIAAFSTLLVATTGWAQSPAGSVGQNPPTTPPVPVASPSASPAPGRSPKGPDTDERLRVRGPLKSQARKLYPNRIEPMESPMSSASPGKTQSTARENASPSPIIRKRPEHLPGRSRSPTSRPGGSPVAISPTPAASASASPSSTP